MGFKETRTISSSHNVQLRYHGMVLVLQVDVSSRGDWASQSPGKIIWLLNANT